MQRFKRTLVIFICLLIINFIIPVYADDELEEISITGEEIEQILETTTDLSKIPVINSRNAIIYDRVTRKDIIWERRK